MSKYQVDMPGGQVGVIGDHARVDQIIFPGPPPSIPLQRPPRAVELMEVCVAYEREIGHSDAKADAQRVAKIRARLEE